jgi:hypothetical protein
VFVSVARLRDSGALGLSVVLLGVAGLAIGIAFAADRTSHRIRDGVWTVEAGPLAWPDPPNDVAAKPLGSPPPTRASGGYALLYTQDGSAAPVAYSPCQPIHLEVNPRRAVAGYMELLEEALAEVSRASGLQFVVDGGTVRAPDLRPPEHRSDGRGWEPVLVAWSDDDEVPELEGEVAGIGGSTRLAKGGHDWLVTGTVIIDGKDAAAILDQPGGRAQVRAVIMHELGHLVGLDHVKDPRQLMYAKNAGQRRFGDGDLAGLAALGSGECVRW